MHALLKQSVWQEEAGIKVYIIQRSYHVQSIVKPKLFWGVSKFEGMNKEKVYSLSFL